LPRALAKGKQGIVVSAEDETLTRRAIELARTSVRAGGGPFGALVARDGRVVAEGANRVTLANDPTAHAEIEALRAACRALGTFQLAGCTVYASCEPCPMCLAALYWARVDRVVFAASRTDAAAAGFDDERLYVELGRAVADRELAMEQVLREDALATFDEWRAKGDRTDY
jgi:tRNA(Arg) A34 adenosine deaminase TadA